MSALKWLERLGTTLPDGVIVGARGDHYFLHPETKDDAKHKQFVQKFKAKTDSYPIYSVYHMVQAVAGLKAGYEAAMKANGGKWPTTEEVADAMHSIEFKGHGRAVKMRADGQGLEDQLLGVTKKTAKYPFPVMDQMMIIPADVTTTPVGQKSPEWVKSIKSDILQTKVKTYSAN